MVATPLTRFTAQRPTVSAHHARLRKAVKQMVIELGCIEHCLAAGTQDSHLRRAATDLDSAIDAVNEYLKEQ